ncbi:flagellar basal body P-ring protein FlgI [Campylobacter sputorum]|nr:flagellar basal body P-ring protein FlgI [Campylobacter sputorum subsp. sputorum]
MMRFMKYMFIAFFACNFLNAAKIGDIANVVGVRENQLIGYGLVVGLKGTGDGTTSEFTLQSISNMLQTVGMKINQDDIKSKNTAAVMVTASLPAFARQGDKINIVISSLGDAKSLQGGTLLMTALKGVDGDIYAIAQGSVSIGGKNEGTGNNAAGNHPTVAVVSQGALVEKEVLYDIYNQNFADLSLKTTNFNSATTVQNAINRVYGEVAVATDPRTIRLMKPEGASMVDFLSQILQTEVDYKPQEKIVINERTGTIVSGVNITVDPVIISHGGITLKIEPQSYNPAPENTAANVIDLGGETSIDGAMNTLNIGTQKTTVANVTRALNRLGATPKDIIAILQNLKEVGAIHADLEIM